MFVLLSNLASVLFCVVFVAIIVIWAVTASNKMKRFNEKSRAREMEFFAQNGISLAEMVKSPNNQESKRHVEKLPANEKIVVLDGSVLNPGDLSWDGFKEFGSITVYDVTPQEKVVERIGNASIVITNKAVISREIIEACPNIKYIGVIATGYNVVDVKAAGDNGIVVTNVPGYGTDAVAQFTFSLMLELCNNVGKHSESVMKGDWCRQENFSYWLSPLSDLSGKTLGIIGFGNIGKKVSEIALAFGMNVLVYSRTRKQANLKLKWVSMEELFAASDIVTLHCPLTDENKEMINKDTIELMKDGAMLINTARGGLVNEEALVEALKSGKLSGAALDVVSEEPMKENSLLLNAKNLIVTPHIAWASHEARERLMDIAVENARAFLLNEPQNVVSE